MKSEVSLVRCETYSEKEVAGAVSKALAHIGGIKKFVRRGNKVLLKVNLLTGTAPEAAVTTHPEVVRAMIREVRYAGGIPLVGDCSGFEGPPNKGRYLGACDRAGFVQVCEEEKASLVHLSAESIDIDNPEGRTFKRFTLAKQAVDADVLISLPKLKTHGLTLFTGGVKNNFGCLPGLEKAKMHLRANDAELFSQMLVDLLGAVKPELILMDAVIGMEGNGPRNGNPKKAGAILASTDAVALDAVACAMVGISPLTVPTTRLANEQNVGVGDLAKIRVLGESIKDMRVDFQLPSGPEAFFRAKGLLRFLRNRMVAKPVLVNGRCKGCWTCVEHCPAGALSKNGKIPSFDYKKCIRCYCCQELCPSNAIELKKPLMSRIFG